jgi:hypothetical protein
MRKETHDVASAFIKGVKCKRKNSGTDGQTLWLFDEKIAWREPDGSVCMTMAGHGTRTTRDRLNGLCFLMHEKCPFHQKKGVQYYDDHEITTDQVITVHSLITFEDEHVPQDNYVERMLAVQHTL